MSLNLRLRHQRPVADRQHAADGACQQHRRGVSIELAAGLLSEVLHERPALRLFADVDHVQRHAELLGLAIDQLGLLGQPVGDDAEFHRASVCGPRHRQRQVQISPAIRLRRYAAGHGFGLIAKGDDRHLAGEAGLDLNQLGLGRVDTPAALAIVHRIALVHRVRYVEDDDHHGRGRQLATVGERGLGDTAGHDLEGAGRVELCHVCAPCLLQILAFRMGNRSHPLRFPGPTQRELLLHLSIHADLQPVVALADVVDPHQLTVPVALLPDDRDAAIDPQAVLVRRLRECQLVVAVLQLQDAWAVCVWPARPAPRRGHRCAAWRSWDWLARRHIALSRRWRGCIALHWRRGWRWRRYGLGRASGRLSRLRVYRAGVGLGAADDRPERGRVAGAYLERNRLWPGQVVLVLLELGVDLAHRRPAVLVDVGVVLARVAL